MGGSWLAGRMAGRLSLPHHRLGLRCHGPGRRPQPRPQCRPWPRPAWSVARSSSHPGHGHLVMPCSALRLDPFPCSSGVRRLCQTFLQSSGTAWPRHDLAPAQGPRPGPWRRAWLRFATVAPSAPGPPSPSPRWASGSGAELRPGAGRQDGGPRKRKLAAGNPTQEAP